MDNLILDFSGLCYEEGLEQALEKASVVDFRSVEGTNCYCDDSAAHTIRDEVKALPVKALHWIDTGDYHYVSRFWLEKAASENPGRPFALLLFDHHPDMQEPAFGDVISCGGWARDAFKSIDELSQVLMMGINPDLELEFLDLMFDGVLAVTSEDFRHTGDKLGTDVTEMISLLEPGIPVYVSIDLDALTQDCARTNWDQGTMTMAQLEAVLDAVSVSHEILGVDVCGGITREKGASDSDLELNLSARLALRAFVDNLVER